MKPRWQPRHILSICTAFVIYTYKGMFLHKIKVYAEYYDLHETEVLTKTY